MLSKHCTQPFSSALARKRQASVDATAAQTEAHYVAKFNTADRNIDEHKMKPVTRMPPVEPQPGTRF